MCSWDRTSKDQVDIRGTSPTTIAFILFDPKAVFDLGLVWSDPVRFRGRIPTQKRNVFMGQNFQRPSRHTWHKSNHNCIHTFRPKSGIWPGARVKWPIGATKVSYVLTVYDKKTSTMRLEILFSSFRILGCSKRNAHFLVFGEGRYTKLESVFEGSVGRESDFLVFSPLGTL